MARKKNITKSFLVDAYMQYILEHGHNPPSVYKFAKENNFEESLFYQFFGSFEAIEQDVFAQFFRNTTSILDQSADYQSYDARTKLISFYYTFFEVLTANRSYVMVALKNDKQSLKNLEKLKTLGCHFRDYVNSLEIDRIDFQNSKIDKLQEKTMAQSAWFQLLFTIKFWLEDNSPNFEKTDVFIEKSINTTFDLINTKPLESVIDLGKFLFKQKMNY
ncbi:MAG: TetR/AcrR family transcriptional regulator [Flavobacteriaceae bacterium]|nr:TetR/AcrR family transcriptional regulator [Flavobacteriaceae bacterium]